MKIEFTEDDASIAEGGLLVVAVSVSQLPDNANATVEVIPITIGDFKNTYQKDPPSGVTEVNPAECEYYSYIVKKPYWHVSLRI